LAATAWYLFGTYTATLSPIPRMHGVSKSIHHTTLGGYFLPANARAATCPHSCACIVRKLLVRPTLAIAREYPVCVWSSSCCLENWKLNAIRRLATALFAQTLNCLVQDQSRHVVSRAAASWECSRPLRGGGGCRIQVCQSIICCGRTDLCSRRKQHHTSMQCWTRRDPPRPPGAPSGLSMARQAVRHVKHHRLTCRRKEITGQQRLLATMGQPRAGLPIATTMCLS
jgi:hypothetical protein